MDYRDRPGRDYDPATFERQLYEFGAGIDPLEPEEVRRDRQEYQSRLTAIFSDICRHANHFGLNWGNIVVIESEDPTSITNFFEQLQVIAESDADDDPTLSPNDPQLARYIVLITWQRFRQLYPQYSEDDQQNIDVKSLQLDILADEHLDYLSQAKILTIIAGLNLDGEGIDLGLLKDKRALEQAITKHEWEEAINDEIIRQAEADKSDILDSINEFLSEHPLPMHDDLNAKVLSRIEVAIDLYLKGYREKADRYFAAARTGADELGIDVDNLLGFIDYMLGRPDDEPGQP